MRCVTYGWHLAIGKGFVDSVQLELRVDILLLGLDVRGDVNSLGAHICGWYARLKIVRVVRNSDGRRLFLFVWWFDPWLTTATLTH